MTWSDLVVPGVVALAAGLRLRWLGHRVRRLSLDLREAQVRSAALLRAIDEVEDVVVVADARGRVVIRNRTAGRIMRIALRDRHGEHCDGICRWLHAPTVALPGPQPDTSSVLPPDGSLVLGGGTASDRHLRVAVTSFGLTDEPLGAVLVGHDDTLLKRHLAECEPQARQQDQLREAVAELASTSEVAAALCRAARAATGAVAVALLEADGSAWRPQQSSADDPPVASPPASRALEMLAVQVAADHSCGWFSSVAADLAPGSAVYVPVGADRDAGAVLAVALPRLVTSADAPVLAVLDGLALQAAAALERQSRIADLERLASSDPLTGLANRRTWNAELDRELARAVRGAAPLSLLMLDLDYFKAFNDVFGHVQGDRLLVSTASVWSGLLRPTDVLARLGGEEFGLLLPGASLAHAVAVAQKLMAAVPAAQTCSVGIACWQGETAEELTAAADAAMYQAKRAGRNRVLVAGMNAADVPPLSGPTSGPQ